MAGKVGRRRGYLDDRPNRPGDSAARAARSERVVWLDPAYDETGLRASRPDIVPALLQLLGWFGWLGIGYVAWGRVVLGALMLVGWWAAFWVLSFFTLVTQTVALPLAVLAWVLVPPITSVALWIEANERPVIGRSAHSRPNRKVRFLSRDRGENHARVQHDPPLREP